MKSEPILVLFLLLAALLGGCVTREELYQEGVDDGYSLGGSDAIKREYWLKQALERNQTAADEGELWYYLNEEDTEKDDGRILVPHRRATQHRE